MKIVIEPTNKNQKGESFPRIELSLQDDLLDLDTCLIELVYPALHCIGYDTSKLEEELRDHGYPTPFHSPTPIPPFTTPYPLSRYTFVFTLHNTTTPTQLDYNPPGPADLIG